MDQIRQMGRKTRRHWERSRNLRTRYWFLRRRIFIRRTFHKFCPIRGASKVNKFFYYSRKNFFYEFSISQNLESTKDAVVFSNMRLIICRKSIKLSSINIFHNSKNASDRAKVSKTSYGINEGPNMKINWPNHLMIMIPGLIIYEW